MLKIYLSSLICLLSLNVSAQFYSVFHKDFNNKDSLFDLSELLLWGDNTITVSAFETGMKADAEGHTKASVHLSQEAVGMGGYNTGSTYTSTAFDIMFDTLSHRNDTIAIEWDYLSEALNGNGESGRFGIALLHNYPVELPQFNDIYNSKDAAPFGRPAYNLRLLNGVESTKQAYLFYGGGKDLEGEFEKLGDGTWLPGFISGPGGISPGSVADYPQGPVKIANTRTVSATKWHHYTWLIYPEKMEVYWRESTADSSLNEIIMSMYIPFAGKDDEQIIQQLNEFHNTSINEKPHLYNWFDSIQGIRFYFRSLQNGYLANVHVSSTRHIPKVTAPEAPIISPLAGTYFDSVEISLSAIPGADIYYTLDGTKPTLESNIYAQPFWIYENTQVMASAYKEGLFSDSVSFYSYVIDHSMNLPLLSEKQQIQVFPNPFVDEFYLEGRREWNNIHLQLMDVTGRTLSVMQKGSGSSLTFPARNLKSGIYYLKIITDNESSTTVVLRKIE